MFDTCFQQWAFHPEESDCMIWCHVYEEFPEIRENIDEAKDMLRNIYRALEEEMDEDLKRVWKQIEDEIDRDKE